MSEQDESFFLEPPSGIDIAHYFIEKTDRRNDGYSGIDLFREGQDYCYLWVTSMIDHDLWVSYLLDVRTNVESDREVGKFYETRDFLFVHHGVGGVFEVEWHNQPIRFDAAGEAHMDRHHDGMLWFVSRDEGAIEANKVRR